MCLAKESVDDLNILDPENIIMNTDEEQNLNLKFRDSEKEFQNVEVNPAFPLSEVGSYLSLLDEEGNEIGMLRDISQLDQSSKIILEEILDKIYFMPKIIKIYSIEEEFGVTTWDVETERGHRVFEIRSRRRDVRPFGQGRIIIHDIDGNRYEIEDHHQLDKESQKILRSEI